jgi:enamine deaminase RidA (YjgF/YER057c/UK114 family)
MTIIAELVAGAAAVAAVSSSQDGRRTQAEVVMPTQPRARKFFEEWGFSEAIVDGDRVYLSGIVAGPRPGQDQSAAFDDAFRMIGQVLERAGSSWDAVLDITTFHTDLPAQMDAFVAVKNRYVRGPFPTWTAIDIDRLVPDNGLVEIKVVARKNKAAAKK